MQIALAQPRVSTARIEALVAGDSAAGLLMMAGTLRAAGYHVVTSPSCARISDYVDQIERRGASGGLLVLDGTVRPWVATAVLATLRGSGRQLPTVAVFPDDANLLAQVRRLGVTEVLVSAWRPRALRQAVARLVARHGLA